MSTPGSGHSGDSAVVPGHLFTGGRLAVTPRAELLGWLAGFGLEPGGDETG